MERSPNTFANHLKLAGRATVDSIFTTANLYAIHNTLDRPDPSILMCVIAGVSLNLNMNVLKNSFEYVRGLKRQTGD